MAGRRGVLRGRITFAAYKGYWIALSEVIDIDRGPDPRMKYSYQLLGPRLSIWGFHREPTTHPEMPDHFHPEPGRPHRIKRTASLHLGDVFDLGWKTVESFYTAPRPRR